MHIKEYHLEASSLGHGAEKERHILKTDLRDGEKEAKVGGSINKVEKRVSPVLEERPSNPLVIGP